MSAKTKTTEQLLQEANAKIKALSDTVEKMQAAAEAKEIAAKCKDSANVLVERGCIPAAAAADAAIFLVKTAAAGIGAEAVEFLNSLGAKQAQAEEEEKQEQEQQQQPEQQAAAAAQEPAASDKFNEAINALRQSASRRSFTQPPASASAAAPQSKVAAMQQRISELTAKGVSVSDAADQAEKEINQQEQS